MNKLMIISLLFIIGQAYAGTIDKLTLNGKVEEVLDVSIIQESIARTIPIDVSQNGVKVATIMEKTVAPHGFRVKITSSHQGNLKRTDGPEVLPYNLTYNNMPVDLAIVRPSITNISKVIMSEVTSKFFTSPFLRKNWYLVSI